MKYLLLAMLVLMPAQSHAERRGSPFPPAVDKRFDELENDTLENSNTARKYAKAIYDVAVDGGESTSHALGVTLPAGAIITSFYVYINTAFTDSGTGSVALQCAGTRDLMAYQDLTLVPIDRVFARTMDATNAFGTAALVADAAAIQGLYYANQAGASVPTACEVTAVVRGDDGFVVQTAGKLTTIIEYFIR